MAQHDRSSQNEFGLFAFKMLEFEAQCQFSKLKN